MNQQNASMQARDLQNLMDLMNHEAVAYQKARAYAAMMQDSNAQRVVNDVCQHHKQSFDTMDQYLSTKN